MSTASTSVLLPPVLRASLAMAVVAGLSAAAAAQLVFEPSVLSSLDNTVYGHALGDLDGDGDADLVIATVVGPPLVRLSDGAGLYAPSVAVDPPTLLSGAVALADLDGDGVLDLITGSSAGAAPMLWVLPGLGDGGFGTPTGTPLGPSNFVNTLLIEVGDADGDGDLDVAAAEGPGGFVFPTSSELRLLLNDGTGALSTVLFAPDPAPEALRRAYPLDANGDAFPDLVVVTTVIVDFYQYPRMHVLVGTAGGGFVSTQYVQDIEVVAVADLDGDGWQDLLTAIDYGELVQIRPGNGSGVFAPGAITPSGFTSAFLALGDFDGDRVQDLVAANFKSAHVLRGAGLAGFPGPVVPFSFPSGSVVLPRAADVDGDGRLDLVTLLNNSSVQPKVGVARNRTYTAAEPLTDLGFALAGGKGFPVQVAQGQFAGGDPFSFTLHGAPANGAAYHVVGLSQLQAPFKGGIVVPKPDLITGPWLAGPDGKLVIAGTWPSGVPAGLTLLLQFWFADAQGAAGFAASSAVAVTLP